MSFLGVGEQITENAAVQFAIDAAVVTVGVLVVNSLVIQPIARSWMKKEEPKTEPKPEPSPEGPKGGKKVDPKPEPTPSEILRQYAKQDAGQSTSVKEDYLRFSARMLEEMARCEGNPPSNEFKKNAMEEMAKILEKSLVEFPLTDKERPVIQESINLMRGWKMGDPDPKESGEATLKILLPYLNITVKDFGIAEEESPVEDLEKEADEAIDEMEKAADAFVAKHGKKAADQLDLSEEDRKSLLAAVHPDVLKAAQDGVAAGIEALDEGIPLKDVPDAIRKKAEQKAKAKERKAAQKAKQNANA
jgi:hypothetical protein